ncbi:type-F conjugative transfer system protein TrbI [Parasphingorhabdus sp. JC815]|uniref:type-F conjugative transfer system protein TrbI n=1 Tax=Parasphingorhabdus sp. JC815 TaxID=3232140 RepID=UPI0034577B4C
MTEPASLLSPKPHLPRLALLLGCIVAVLWAGWVSRAILEPDKPQIVTVRLAQTMGKFVEAQARGSKDPEATKANIAVFLRASEQAVQDMGRDGRIILVDQAVLAGNAPDATPELERRIATRLIAGEAR